MRNNGSFAAKDLTGARNGKVTAIGRAAGKAKDGSYMWNMVCDCGNSFVRQASKFKKSVTCGCGMRDNAGQFAQKDLTGITIKDCTALEPTEERSECSGYVVWKIRCNLCDAVYKRAAYSITRKTISHDCKQWWAKYRQDTHVGRPAIPDHGSHINTIYARYMKAAKERGHTFQLTKDEVRGIVVLPCHYCGTQPMVKTTSENLSGVFSWTGIDRVDSNIGYIINNVVPCCTTCNFGKRDLPVERFLEWVESIYRHSIQGR